MGLSEQDWALISADGDRAKLCASRFPRVLARLLNAARAEAMEAQAQEFEIARSLARGWKDRFDERARRIGELEACLKEVADDLEAELRERYRETLDHPAMARRFERDMDGVNKARALLPADAKEPSDDR